VQPALGKKYGCHALLEDMFDPEKSERHSDEPCDKRLHDDCPYDEGRFTTKPGQQSEDDGTDEPNRKVDQYQEVGLVQKTSLCQLPVVRQNVFLPSHRL